MSVRADHDELEIIVPEPEFTVEAAAHLPFAATPTMVFSARATDPVGFAIQSIALSVQVMIDPARRGYDEAARDRLAELFGPPAGWAPSTQGLSWARVGAVVPGFVLSTAFTIEVPCTYDLEVASAKYFHALADPQPASRNPPWRGAGGGLRGAGGEVPLSFHFNGTVFYRGPGDRLQVAPVPWSRTAQFRMPVDAWRETIAEHYPGGGWIRLGHDTLDALNGRRAARGLASFDACVAELLNGDADAR
jgi:hypothetical protein